MQSVSSWIWTRVAVSISYDDNRYTTGTSFAQIIYVKKIYLTWSCNCYKESLLVTWNRMIASKKLKTKLSK